MGLKKRCRSPRDEQLPRLIARSTCANERWASARMQRGEEMTLRCATVRFLGPGVGFLPWQYFNALSLIISI